MPVPMLDLNCRGCRTRREVPADEVRWHRPAPTDRARALRTGVMPVGFYTWLCPTCGPTRQYAHPAVEPLLVRGGVPICPWPAELAEHPYAAVPALGEDDLIAFGLALHPPVRRPVEHLEAA